MSFILRRSQSKMFQSSISFEKRRAETNPQCRFRFIVRTSIFHIADLRIFAQKYAYAIEYPISIGAFEN